MRRHCRRNTDMVQRRALARPLVFDLGPASCGGGGDRENDNIDDPGGIAGYLL